MPITAENVLRAVNAKEAIDMLIVGDAHGLDTSMFDAAGRLGISRNLFTADWKTFGKSAGHRRNQRMIYEGQPHYGLAFAHKPLDQSRGTKDMVNLMIYHQIPFKLFNTTGKDSDLRLMEAIAVWIARGCDFMEDL